jgi:hypothetical protein
VTDYSPHHEPFQYYRSTSNPKHLAPTSVAAIGQTDRANHQYDLSDFDAALAAHNLPAVSSLKAAEYQDGHAGYSDPIDEQHFVVDTIDKLERSEEWSSTAVVIAYDDSDGWYDHQLSPIVNGSTDPALDVPGRLPLQQGQLRRPPRHRPDLDPQVRGGQLAHRPDPRQLLRRKGWTPRQPARPPQATAGAGPAGTGRPRHQQPLTPTGTFPEPAVAPLRWYPPAGASGAPPSPRSSPPRGLSPVSGGNNCNRTDRAGCRPPEGDPAR